MITRALSYKKKRSYSLSIPSLASFFLASYIVYNFGLMQTFLYIPYLSTVLLALAVGLTLLADFGRLYFRQMQGWVFLTLFFLLSTVTGLLFALNQEYVFTQVRFLAESLLFGYSLIRMAQRSSGLSLVVFSILVCALLYAGYFLLTGGVNLGSGRYSMAENINSNTLGVFLMFGIWCLMECCRKMKAFTLSIVLCVVGIAVMMYVIIQTGSRKAAIGTIVLITYWLIDYLGPIIKEKKIIVKIATIIVTVFAVYYIASRYGALFFASSTRLMQRMDRLYQTDYDTQWKFGMIADALRVWLEHPLFGVGLNNYRFFSAYGLYAHNSYAEAFACTGLLGTVPLFAAFISPGKVILQAMHRKRVRRQSRISEGMYLILYLMFLYICFGQICFYNANLMMIFYVLIAYAVKRESEEADA